MHFCIKKVPPVPANPRCDRACCPWGYLASYLAFFPKRCHFGAKTAIFYFLSYLHGLFHACVAFAYKHRSKSANEPASIGPKCHLASNAANYSKSIWQQCHVGSNPTVCAKDSTLRGVAFYFCSKLCKGCKVGFEQPVPGALRPAGQKRPSGAFLGRGRLPPSAPSITAQFHIG